MEIRDSGSNYQFFEKNVRPNLPRSSFDLSHIVSFDADLMNLYPVCVIPTHPNEDFTIEIEALFRAINPPVVPLASRQRAFFHFYYSDFKSLWRGAEVTVSKGHSGNYVGKIPGTQIDFANKSLYKRGSLADFLGFNVGKDSTSTTGTYNTPFEGMLFMMYQRIYRDLYLHQNYVSTGDYREYQWFPFYDQDFSLPLGMDYVPLAQDTTKQKAANGSSWSPEMIGLGLMRKRPWTEDYFVAARPWPQRGNAASIDYGISLSGFTGSIGIEGTSGFLPLEINVFNNSGFTGYSTLINSNYDMVSSITNEQNVFAGAFTAGDTTGSAENAIATPFPLKIASSGDSTANVTLTMAQLRDLNSAQRMLEKMARTDGTYKEFVETFFGQTPRSAEDHRPYYIGGTVQTIEISEVLQTGGTTATSAQGEQTGYARSLSSGYIGKFHSDNYGYIMGIMSIVPDTYYAQGLNRGLTRRTQEDLYVPERAGLSPRPILNQEIWYDLSQPQGEDPTKNKNVDIFAYQDPFDEFRFMANQVHGKVADSSNDFWSPMIQTRFFDSLPTYSESFVNQSPSKNWVTSVDESIYFVQLANKIRAVRPMPYHYQPAELFDTRG